MNRYELLARYADGERTFRLADLSHVDLSWSDLRNADLSHAQLVVSNLHGVDLRGAELEGTYMRGADVTAVKINASQAVALLRALGVVVVED